MTPAERRLQLDIADAIAHLLANASMPSWAEQIRTAAAQVREGQKSAAHDERDAQSSRHATYQRILDAASKVPGVASAAIISDNFMLNVSVVVRSGYVTRDVLDSVSRAVFDFKPIGYLIAVTQEAKPTVPPAAPHMVNYG